MEYGNEEADGIGIKFGIGCHLAIGTWHFGTWKTKMVCVTSWYIFANAIKAVLLRPQEDRCKFVRDTGTKFGVGFDFCDFSGNFHTFAILSCCAIWTMQLLQRSRANVLKRTQDMSPCFPRLSPLPLDVSVIEKGILL
jgi:hypothetical protein